MANPKDVEKPKETSEENQITQEPEEELQQQESDQEEEEDEGEEERPSEAEPEAPAKKKHHHRKPPKAKDKNYELKKRIYDMRNVRHHFHTLGKKSTLRDPALLASEREQIDKNKKEVMDNQQYIGEKRAEKDLSETTMKLLDRLERICGEAMLRMGDAETAMNDSEKSMQLLDIYDEADTAKVNVERNPDQFKTMAGFTELLQFLHQIQAKRAGVGNCDGLAQAQDKAVMLDQTIAGLKEQVEQVKRSMDPKKAARAEKLVAKRENLSAKQEALNKKYHAKKPIVRLIRYAMKLNQKDDGDEDPEKADVAGFVDEHIMGNGMDVGDIAAQMVTGDDDSSATDVLGGFTAKAVKTAFRVLKGDLSIEQGEKLAEGCQGVLSFLAPVWKGYIALRNIKSYFKETKNMSPDEKMEKQIEIVGSSFDAVISLFEPVLSALKLATAIPFLGSLIGLCSNAVSALISIVQWDTNANRRDDALEKKEDIKEKMVEKNQKYQADQDLKSENLLGFARMKTDVSFFGKKTTSAHIHKNRSEVQDRVQKRLGPGVLLPFAGDLAVTHVLNKTIDAPLAGTYEAQEKDLEGEVGASGNMYARMAELKKKKTESEEGLTKEEKQEYYKMKSLGMMRDYKALKEASYVNKKRIDAGAIELVHTAVDVAKNIADFFPGLGSLLAKILGMTNVGAKYLHKGFTAGKQKWRDAGWVGGDQTKTTAAKEKKRSGMAQAMYDQMLFVGDYMSPVPDSDPTFTKLDPETGDQVEKRMDFLNTETSDLGSKFSELLTVGNKTTLLAKMASAFGREG